MATANLLQTSVSGGTQNALSLQGDGVFFPKASTTSRLALTLTTTDKGFIVYDTTDNNIYFWNGAAWESVPSSGDAGANGSVQYNDNGIVSGATNFVWDKVNGRVGIGLASGMTAPLEVQSNASGTSINVRGRSDNSGAMRFFANDGTTQQAYISADNTNIDILSVSTRPIRLSVNAVVVATVLNGGNVSIANGNLVMSTSGKGIDFSAVTGGTGTATANVLNDYEEGAFTPTVVGTTADGTIGTYYANTGRYTKVGRVVTVQVYLAWGGGAGATGDLAFAGLPFTTGNIANNYTSGAIGYFGDIALTASNVPCLFASPNATRFLVNQFPVGGGSLTAVPYDNNGAIMFTATYFTA